MEIKKNSGNERILLALQDANKSMTVKSLAEKSDIAYKNIHRNISQLILNHFIRTQTLQEGRCRNKYIDLTSKGREYNPTLAIKTPEKETIRPVKVEYKPDVFEDEFQVEDIQFGIRFYSWLAQNLHIPNYSSLRLNDLKVEIGLRLIYQSGLVNISKILDKLENERK